MIFNGRPIRKIIVRGTNWVGDAVMTLPALAALKKNFPYADITVLAKKWVAPVYASHEAVKDIMILDKDGPHKGVKGLFRIAADVRKHGFDLAVLFQNAFEAALIVRLAGVPLRIGYNTDARGFLLNHRVKLVPEDRQVHETDYYVRMLARSGLAAEWSRPSLRLADDLLLSAENHLKSMGIAREFLIGLAPGAAFGTAKMWPAERYAAAADDILSRTGGAALVFGSRDDAETAQAVVSFMKKPGYNLAGQTDLMTAAALIHRCRLFLGNDSGLMHVACAVDTPTVAVFGPTNPVTVAPADRSFRLVRHEVDCAPCRKQTCDRPEHVCMDLVTVEDVIQAAMELLEEQENG